MPSYRKFLKNSRTLSMMLFPTDLQRGIPDPPLEKPCPPGSPLIPLIPSKDFKIGGIAPPRGALFSPLGDPGRRANFAERAQHAANGALRRPRWRPPAAISY